MKVTTTIHFWPPRVVVQVVETEPESEPTTIDTEGQSLPPGPGIAKCRPSEWPVLQLVEGGAS